LAKFAEAKGEECASKKEKCGSDALLLALERGFSWRKKGCERAFWLIALKGSGGGSRKDSKRFATKTREKGENTVVHSGGKGEKWYTSGKTKTNNRRQKEEESTTRENIRRQKEEEHSRNEKDERGDLRLLTSTKLKAAQKKKKVRRKKEQRGDQPRGRKGKAF